MNCSEVQLNISLYADDRLSASEAASVRDHLLICPLCRQRNDDLREIRSQLRSIRRPEMSAAVRVGMREAVRARVRRENTRSLPIGSDLRDWLTFRVMPYTVGVAASFLLGAAFLSMILSAGSVTNSPELRADRGFDSLLLANNSLAAGERPAFISPTDFAHSRMAFSNESPSLNPQGALVALTRSLVRGNMKDEEVVVVADVFGNGLAQISEVVESPRDGRTVSELERAFRAGPASAPFVPAVMENRPESMRIVLKIQSVDVEMDPKRSRRRS